MAEVNTPEGGRLVDGLQVRNLKELIANPSKSHMSQDEIKTSVGSLLSKHGLESSGDLDRDIATLESVTGEEA